uniref:Uncharacterized protein n=1 Tax=Setaria viridis TaxID=4556 RepID=A0A4U6VA83_SETVI|nr:hypothetical protein SEVIR_3G020150v2 [Setaria viridis]
MPWCGAPCDADISAGLLPRRRNPWVFPGCDEAFWLPGDAARSRTWDWMSSSSRPSRCLAA